MTTIDAAISWLSKIPGTFWGVLAGSAFTLLGTWFTNYAGDRRQRIQFENDVKNRRGDAEYLTRKEVLLEAASAIVQLQGSIGQLGDLLTPLSKFGVEVVRCQSTIAKSYLVASDETVELLVELLKQLQAAASKALPLRANLDVAKSQLTSAQEEFDRRMIYSRAATEALIESNRIVGFDRLQYQLLESEQILRSSLVDQSLAEVKKFAAEVSQGSLVLMRLIVGQAAALTPAYLKCVVAARRELNTPTKDQRIDKAFESLTISIQQNTEHIELAIQNLLDQHVRPSAKVLHP